MWIYTEAVVRNGQRHMENFMVNKMNSITVAVTGAWVIFNENHVWIPKITIELKECTVLESLHLTSSFRASCSVEKVVVLGFGQP